MALYRVRHVWTPRPNVPSQTAVWTWGVEILGAVPSGAALRGAFDTAVRAGGSSGLNGMLRQGMYGKELAVYPASGGAAVEAINTDVLGSFGSGGAIPGQIAAVVSAQISGSRGVQPKGRTFYGPLSQNANNASAGMMSVASQNAFGNFAVLWHNALKGLGCTPVVLAGDGSVSRGPIISYAVDNALDVMRSRQYERTAISYYTPAP